MKLTRPTYISLFFLLTFLFSLSAGTYKRVHSSISKSDLQHTHKLTYSKQENNAVSDTEFLFEENETETENDFHAQVFTLPFFIAYFQYESFQPKPISAQPLAEKLTTPIYIEVCNFRI